MLSFFPRGVLDEILNLIESVSEDFPSYSFKAVLLKFIADGRGDESFFGAQNFTHWDYLPLIYKIMKKYIKSELEAFFLKPTANDQSNKSLLCCFKLISMGNLTLPQGYIRHKSLIKS